ncbi:HlyD family type I secretion periplasmic adaptor subunit [Microvirga terrestris]|uniref:Membrane fusion protein (MFP) family protein n=1 Tax=Microvirga terrestris TaxID=2791024 RepID=A0ABS0HV18_9HYPH|nr:HlyD family type I secretion periplasmic adaptor subunit [Microvirga terrestris]MBF9197340.1 HlyD family type I secretion periplasmic adaptor subunit [Microvirga terrestris]
MSMASTLSSGSTIGTSFDSPRAPLLVGGIAAVLMILVFGVWASMMSVAGGAVANGKVALEGNRKALQHREGGTVKAILVREGQRVEKGQALIELNPTDLQAEVAILDSTRLATMVRLARLRTEVRNDSQILWPADVSALRSQVQARSIVDQETAVFEARLTAYRGNINLLQQQIDGRERQIAGLETRLIATQSQLTSVDQEHTSLLPLVEKGLIARPRVLALERTSASLAADLQTIRSQIDAERSSIQQAETQIAQLEKDRREAAAKEIAEMEARLAEVAPRLTWANERLQNTTLFAPESGYVYGLAVFNSGAVVTPGQIVMEIVPSTDALVLSVEISPKDVERVRKGQHVTVHLLAYSQRYQSVIKGHLDKVSPDRFDNPQTGAAFYRGTVSIEPGELRRAQVELVPGMPVNVVIETGERTILEYLLDPIFRVTDYALRER